MTMSEEGQGQGQDVLVIEDSAGNIYLIRRETLERGRVSDEYKGQLREAIEGGDVAGFGGRALAPGAQFAPARESFQIIQAFSLRVPSAVSSSQIADALRLL